MPTSPASAPIGVFDSGVGGLSVLRALRAQLPNEHFIYVADSGHAPYGEKTPAEITERSRRITHFLRRNMHCKALVIACNTATAIAAPSLRQDNSGWPIIGIEPAIKPAALHTRTGAVGVLATQGTLSSAKYQALRERVLAGHQPEFGSPLALREVACKGLAHAIEQLSHSDADAASRAQAQAQVQTLITRYLHALGPIGQDPAAVDAIVLGCTHYPLVDAEFRQHLPTHVRLWDPGDRVAHHTADVLKALGQQAGVAQPASHLPALQLWSSGQPAHLAAAARHWLGVQGLAAQALPC